MMALRTSYSGGQLDIDLRHATGSSRYRRIIPAASSSPWALSPGRQTPACATAAPPGRHRRLDGRGSRLADGSLPYRAYLLHEEVHSYIGLQTCRKTPLGPWFQPRPRRIDASIT